MKAICKNCGESAEYGSARACGTIAILLCPSCTMLCELEEEKGREVALTNFLCRAQGRRQQREEDAV